MSFVLRLQRPCDGMVDITDLKSVADYGVRVRVSLGAPSKGLVAQRIRASEYESEG